MAPGSDGGAYDRGQAAQGLITLMMDSQTDEATGSHCRRALSMLAEGNLALTRVMVKDIYDHLPEEDDHKFGDDGGAFGMTAQEIEQALAEREAGQAAYATQIEDQGCTEPPDSLFLAGSYAHDDPESHFRYADMFYEMRYILDDSRLTDLEKLERGLIEASTVFAMWTNPDMYPPFALKTAATARHIIEQLLNNEFRLARELCQPS